MVVKALVFRRKSDAKYATAMEMRLTSSAIPATIDASCDQGIHSRGRNYPD